MREKKTKKKVIIELNIISSLELKKYLKSFLFIWLFFLFSQILFYTHNDLRQNNSRIIRNCPTVTSTGSHHA